MSVKSPADDWQMVWMVFGEGTKIFGATPRSILIDPTHTTSHLIIIVQENLPPNNNSASVRKQVVAVNVKPRRRITSVNLLILQTNALPPTSTFDKVCPAFQTKSQQLVACCYFLPWLLCYFVASFYQGCCQNDSESQNSRILIWLCVSIFITFDVAVCFSL